MSRAFLLLKTVISFRGNIAVQSVFPFFQQNVSLFCTRVTVPPPPKKPPTAYLRFLKDRRSELLKEKPGLNIIEQIKIIAAEWRMLDKDRKDVYRKEYVKEWAEYTKMKESYVLSLTDEQQSELKEQKVKKHDRRVKTKMNSKIRELDMPKPPKPALSIFMDETNLAQKGMRLRELMKIVAAEWKSLTEDQRKVYMKKAEEQRIKWNEEFRKWRANIQQSGHEDVLDFLAKKKGFPKAIETVEAKSGEKDSSASDKPVRKSHRKAEKV